jgi:hypothetical protein
MEEITSVELLEQCKLENLVRLAKWLKIDVNPRWGNRELALLIHLTAKNSNNRQTRVY